MKPWRKKPWGIPPAANAAFGWAMADVRDVYHRPYAPQHPLVWLAASRKQQGKETRLPLPAAPGEPARCDYAYERHGVSNLLRLFAPLAGWRHVHVTEQRPKVDWAHGRKDLWTGYFPEAETVTMVQDHLKTHHPSSLYDAFAPEEAKALLERYDFHYTPQHGSWRNMAAIAFSVLQRQC